MSGESAPARVEGHRLALRLVVPDDANYIYGLRIDPRYNTHLSAVTGTAADQCAWIERYKEREAAGAEYYYVIERSDDGLPCGVVRLYNISADHFTWGSWILDENKPRKAALESALLSFGVGFESLAADLAFVDARMENARALAFYHRFGMSELGEDDESVCLEYPAARYFADRDAHWTVVRGLHEDAAAVTRG